MIEARPSSRSTHQGLAGLAPQIALVNQEVAAFTANVKDRLARWQQFLKEEHEKGKKVVIWGSGSKGVSFLSTLGIGDSIDYAVDINPHRQGYYMPGGGQKIVSPDELKSLKPDYVVVMNAVYEQEIREMLDDRSLKPELAVL